MCDTIEQARLEYRPADGIKVLFIAEAPPANPQRFFYFPQIATHDWLYLAMMRALYAEARELDASELRQRKVEYLQRFQADGYYLVDARNEPMPSDTKRAAKQQLPDASLAALVDKVQGLVEPATRVVLISHAVYAVCCEPLRAAGINVVNAEMIDFPSSGRQKEFQRKPGRALDEFLHRTIQSLEASVKFSGAGKAQQKERDRWVVEHFLRGFGLTFDASEIVQPEHDPPDATFRGAAFEVKEIQERGRRRGDEYKQQLAKARAANSSDELLEHFTPEDISIAEVYRRIMGETQGLAETKYRAEAVRCGLDLLFYINLGMNSAWGIDDGERPSIEPLILQGWRSVSFLHGTGTTCVILARKSAPSFLQGQSRNVAPSKRERRRVSALSL